MPIQSPELKKLHQQVAATVEVCDFADKYLLC